LIAFIKLNRDIIMF